MSKHIPQHHIENDFPHELMVKLVKIGYAMSTPMDIMDGTNAYLEGSRSIFVFFAFKFWPIAILCDCWLVFNGPSPTARPQAFVWFMEPVAWARLWPLVPLSITKNPCHLAK